MAIEQKDATMREVFPGVLGGLVIADDSVPLGEIWYADLKNRKTIKLMNLRRECPFDENNCQLGMGHDGPHLVCVPVTAGTRCAERYWVVDDASSIQSRMEAILQISSWQTSCRAASTHSTRRASGARSGFRPKEFHSKSAKRVPRLRLSWAISHGKQAK
jgi:hypothetical protein